jgi:hypothetical protein
VRAELSRKRRRDACGAAVLTGDIGDGGVPIEFVKWEGQSRVLRVAKGIGRRRGSSREC